MSGDERFEQLYKAYFGRVFRLLIRMGFTRARAQDLSQETFVRVYQNFDAYRGEGEWTYLESIARRIAINHVRSFHSAKRSGVEVALDDPVDSIASTAYQIADPTDLAAELVRKESTELLEQAIAELPTGARETLRMFLLGLKYDEIAKTLNVSVDAVKSRLKDSRRLLKEKIGQSIEGGPTE